VLFIQKIRGQIVQRTNSLLSLTSALLVLFLAGSAFVLSFEALKDLAIQVGIMEKMAWLYPAIIDGAIIVFSLSVLRANLNTERTIYPWALVSLFTLLSIILNIIHAEKNLLAQFLAAIPPFALFLSFEMLLSQLRGTAVRLEALIGLDEIVQNIQKKELELDEIVRERSETIEQLEVEIGQLNRKKVEIGLVIKHQSNGKSAKTPPESVKIGQAGQIRTTKKQTAMQHLLEIIRTNPNATLSELALEIGRSKSTVGGYMSELKESGLIEKGDLGWERVKKPAV
jgi:predicted transcriptional regulator